MSAYDADLTKGAPVTACAVPMPWEIVLFPKFAIGAFWNVHVLPSLMRGFPSAPALLLIQPVA